MLLNVSNLTVKFKKPNDKFHTAVDNFNLQLQPNQIHVIAGESGSGKSVTAMGIMDLLGSNAVVTADAIQVVNNNFLTLTKDKKRPFLGSDISMIFQDPIVSLNPILTVGKQIQEVVELKLKLKGKEAYNKTLELLELVEIPSAKSRINAYPFELSGGMNQRILIAMAVAAKPKILIADEPTTALDVTVQNQILMLLKAIQKENNMGIVFITHDLALAAEFAQTITVMYAGKTVESGTIDDVIYNPQHPYTFGLLKALPENNTDKRMFTLEGKVPGYLDMPKGCVFSPRCAFAKSNCFEQSPQLVTSNTRSLNCFYPLSNTLKEAQHA